VREGEEGKRDLPFCKFRDKKILLRIVTAEGELVHYVISREKVSN